MDFFVNCVLVDVFLCVWVFFVCVYLGFILVYFSLFFLIFSLDGDFWLVIISVCFGFFLFAGLAAGLCRVMI